MCAKPRSKKMMLGVHGRDGSQDRWAGAASGGPWGGQRGLGAGPEEVPAGPAPRPRLPGLARPMGTAVFVFPFQAEDEALLSEDDDPIDRRPWTQQHLEAADIRRTPSLALTPPQAEQEVDVLDVNVRGPGQHPRRPPAPGPGCPGFCVVGIPLVVLLGDRPLPVSQTKSARGNEGLRNTGEQNTGARAGERGGPHIASHAACSRANGPVPWEGL